MLGPSGHAGRRVALLELRDEGDRPRRLERGRARRRCWRAGAASVAEGLRVSTIKHAHHAFDVDRPGKDSWTHRQAGATEVLISSERRFALMHELRGEAELTLRELLPKLSPVDLVIVEGFKTTRHRKIEVHRAQQRQAAALSGRPGRRRRSPRTVRWNADCPRSTSTTSTASRPWSASMRSRVAEVLAPEPAGT